MSIAIVTGASGLVGSEASRFFAKAGFQIVGIDNDMRSYFFGEDASTKHNQKYLETLLGKKYHHSAMDIRNKHAVDALFKNYRENIEVVIHTAAQPSHDWAAKEPHTDFTINATGTLNMLEATRTYCPEAVFIFTSTNKVYGDKPNDLPFVEQETRWEITGNHTYYNGIREDMSIDQSLHSLFGASKVAADVLVQEYGRYFGMKTACFRCGCLTGPNHSGAELHGFLSYLMKCAALGKAYTVFGYKGKQVRDNIHTKSLVLAFWEFFKQPKNGEVYNLGGGRLCNCSVLEAIHFCQEITGKEMKWQYDEKNRIGDHQWWISSNEKFRKHYPGWKFSDGIESILQEIYEENYHRWHN